MNAIPPDWSDQLSAIYPKRSGPCGWKGTKLLFALRRALFDATWDDILTGVKRYADYCRKAGIEGSSFIKSPQTFFEDGSWAEQYDFQAPETKEQKERREIAERDGARFAAAVEAGKRCDPAIVPLPGESVGSFETRIRLAHRDDAGVRPLLGTPLHVSGGAPGMEMRQVRRIGGSVAALADRMRVK